MKGSPQIFLSYVRPDHEAVLRLYDKLKDAGYRPWMDTRDILPGEQWDFIIRQAIRRSDFFLVCLSSHSVDRRGYIQREVKEALDIRQEYLDSDIYLIPVRLEPCEIPERLRDFQWVDWFEPDGWDRLGRAIQAGLERRTESAASAPAAPSDAGRPRLRVVVPEDERPGKYRGLIVLVGTGRPGEPPLRQSAWQAIEYHLPDGQGPGLETCWLIASRGETGSLPVAEELKPECEARGVKAHVRGVEGFSLQSAYDMVQRIYAEEVPRAGLSEEEVIADFTGGTKLMSAGMLLACGDRRPMQYMTGRKSPLASVPMLIEFRPHDG